MKLRERRGNALKYPVKKTTKNSEYWKNFHKIKPND
jgi:hypothetical protein